MFADDTNVTISAKDAEDLEEKLNNELNNVHYWLLANKVTVSVDKSEYLTIIRRRRGDYRRIFTETKSGGIFPENHRAFGE